MNRLLLAIALVLLTSISVRAERIWIEAEDANHTNCSIFGEFKGVVSGDRILHIWEGKDPGAGGYTAEYEFAVGSNREHHIWASPSLPPATSSFWWKIDGGKYSHVTEDFDVRRPRMFGVSGVMCWIDLGQVRVSRGKHTLTFMVNERRNSLEHGYLLYMDAILITDEAITPEGLVMKADVPNLTKRVITPIVPVERAVKPGKPVVMGSSVMSVPQSRLLKELGFTLLQTDSEHLYTNETIPGVWDWTSADSGLETCLKAGVKWQYFPHFHWAPEWQRKQGNYVPSKCILHGREISCMSLWSPQILESMGKGFAATAQHYGSGRDKVDALYLAVYGDFGEAIMPMGFHPGEIPLFGEAGSGHDDWWCGDECARKDFRVKMASKYGTVERLNSVWGTQYVSLEQMDYPLPAPNTETAQGRRRWLDFINWYYDSMSDHTVKTFDIARMHFPKSTIVVPLGGGDENLKYAQDNTGIPRALRGTDAHIRSTHGGCMPVPQNYASMLRRIATACKFYKLPFWSEPPSNITAEGEIGRFFESLSCGAYGYWDWGSNPVANQDTFRKYKSFLTKETPVVDVALFYPQTDARLHPERTMAVKFFEAASTLRDVMDYDILDERLIDDGALKGYRVLALFEGSYMEASALRKLDSWVKSGGVVISCNYGPVASVEGDTSIWRGLFGIPETVSEAGGGTLDAESPFLKHASRAQCDKAVAGLSDQSDRSDASDRSDSPNRVRVLATASSVPAVWANPVGKGYGIYFAGSWNSKKAYYELVRDAAYNLSALDSRLKNAAEVDTDWDNTYCTLLPSGEVIAYNPNQSTVKKRIGGRAVDLAPVSLTSVSLAGVK